MFLAGVATAGVATAVVAACAPMFALCAAVEATLSLAGTRAK
jgi:hypothetical protein